MKQILSVGILCFLCVLVKADPQGWITHNNHYYYFSSTSDKPDSENARMTCISFGANLLSIANQEEQNFIDTNVNTGYLIGLRTNSSGEAVLDRKNWFWLDGTEYDVDVFHNWEVGEPENVFEICGRLFNTGRWRNAGCDANYQYICKKKDPCATGTMQCINGDCTVIQNETKYQCDCYAGYTGSKCETDIDQCRSNPCVNGECEDEVNDYSCECTNSGYEGDYCEIDIDECAAGALQCYNGGKCKNTDGSAYCECVPGTTGKQCETDIDECLSSPCNNGTCTDQLNGYECRCFDGYEGVHCQNDINEFGTLKCEYNSTCVNTPGSAHCDCINGTTGERCETNIDDCMNSQCDHGNCEDQLGDYICICEHGYSGKYCETDIDDCINSQCIHGFCEEQLDGYICLCEPGYTGKYCETDINECSTSLLHYTCVNGVCTNTIGSYTCVCSAGYTGSRCVQEVTETYFGAFIGKYIFSSITIAGILAVINIVWLIHSRIKNDTKKPCKQCKLTQKDKLQEYANIDGITQPADTYQDIGAVSVDQVQPYEKLNFQRK